MKSESKGSSLQPCSAENIMSDMIRTPPVNQCLGTYGMSLRYVWRISPAGLRDPYLLVGRIIVVIWSPLSKFLKDPVKDILNMKVSIHSCESICRLVKGPYRYSHCWSASL